MAVTLPAEMVERSGFFFFKDNEWSRIMILVEGFQFPICLTDNIHRETKCMSVSVCVRLFYGNALQGTQIPPKTLSHSFLLLVPRRHM